MLIQLGTFQFAISTAEYETLTRDTNINYARLPILNGTEKLQAIGQEGDVITLEGTVYPEITVRTGGKGGTHSMDTLREMAHARKPQLMTGATGLNLGYWVIETLRTRESRYLGPVPRKQVFQLGLRYYGEAAA